MNKNKLAVQSTREVIRFVVIASASATIGCGAVEEPIGSGTSTPVAPAGDIQVPATPQGTAAGQFDIQDSGSHLKTLLGRTAAVAEGDVTDISYSFDDWDGPRTLVTLSRVVFHLGGEPGLSTIVLRMAGGPLPDGRFMTVSGIARFAHGSRYMVFLTNEQWNLSPLADDTALRLERVDGYDMLVGDSGSFVAGFNAGTKALRFSAEPVFAALQEADDLHRRPELVAGRNTASLASAIAPNKFVEAVAAYAGHYGITTFGRPQLQREQSYPWNRIPSAPDEGP